MPDHVTEQIGDLRSSGRVVAATLNAMAVPTALALDNSGTQPPHVVLRWPTRVTRHGATR